MTSRELDYDLVVNNHADVDGADPQIIYERCLAHIDTPIERGFSNSDTEHTLAPLERSVDWVAGGSINFLPFFRSSVDVTTNKTTRRVDQGMR